MNNIRNFCIISHIDHGKSTLADRFLELTQTVEKRKMREQYLDQMELEREKGITIKLQPVRMIYRLGNSEFILNLIDTPGHVDFTYEVSRSLQAVEGAILLVDATKGIQAQTLANLHLALEQKLVIIPVINKIDSPAARIAEVENEIKELLLSRGIGEKNVYKISAKEGIGTEELLAAIIERVPSPKGDDSKPLRALVFDSVYDSYKGVLAYVRVVDGGIKRSEQILLMASGAKSETIEVGVFKPNLMPAEKLLAGEIGYIATGFKDVGRCRVGDTITSFRQQGVMALPGYKEPKPMIFASFYPANDKDFDFLRDALSKLKLQDAALVFEPEASALGRGFKCGFLGMLHLEIISERLKREFGLNLVITTPSLTYKLTDKRGQETTIYSAHQMPDPHLIDGAQELWAKLKIVSPAQYLGKVMRLFESLEGNYSGTNYLTAERLVVEYEVPLREIIVDFYDKLKSATSGYASMSYEILGWRPAELACLDVLIAGEKEEAFSKIVSRKKVQQEGKALVERLKEVIPPQLFVVSVQAAVSGKIIARENIRALRKDVTGYLYGGDYTRKRKLLEKQKRGKKKMKTIGRVNIPQEAFLAVLKR